MTESNDKPAESKTMLWAGRILSAVPVLMLLMSGTMKFIKPAGFAEGLEHLGWSETTMTYIGVV